MSDTERGLADEIARVRHGDSCTANDLANRLLPWLTDQLAATRKQALNDAVKIAESYRTHNYARPDDWTPHAKSINGTADDIANAIRAEQEGGK